MVADQFSEIRRDLATQLVRISQIQQQLDTTEKVLKQLIEHD
jgi:hypothetical protein